MGWAFTLFVLQVLRPNWHLVFSSYQAYLEWWGQIRTCQSFPISYQVTTLIQENLCSWAVSYMSSTCLTHFLICQTCSKNVPSQRLVRGGREGLFQYKHLFISFLQFFQEFVTNKHWVHLDIAGVMMNKDEVPYLSKGMSGKNCVCVCVLSCILGIMLLCGVYKKWSYSWNIQKKGWTILF